MANIKGKIVLTGGPCAGKTTILSILEKDLTEKGYKVFVVPESATQLINGGIKVFGEHPVAFDEFEKLLFQYQLYKEDMYEKAIACTDSDIDCVIIYDRGILDNKAYVDKEAFQQILSDLGLNELELSERYDMIIHLVTAADGALEYYTLDNNTARSETPEEAIILDRKAMNSWMIHDNVKIVDNSHDFDAKIQRVLNEVSNFLGDPIRIKFQKKFIGHLKDTSFLLNDECCVKADIYQTYVNSGNPEYEKRLRKRVCQEVTSYYLTVQKKNMDGAMQVVMERKLDENAYLKMLETHEILGSINKKRYTFIYEKQYYKLDVFDDLDMVILEIDATLGNDCINIPEFLFEDVAEMTCQDEYYNFNLATQKGKVKVKK